MGGGKSVTLSNVCLLLGGVTNNTDCETFGTVKGFVMLNNEVKLRITTWNVIYSLEMICQRTSADRKYLRDRVLFHFIQYNNVPAVLFEFNSFPFNLI